jgi:hypothetical protein
MKSFFTGEQLTTTLTNLLYLALQPIVIAHPAFSDKLLQALFRSASRVLLGMEIKNNGEICGRADKWYIEIARWILYLDLTHWTMQMHT